MAKNFAEIAFTTAVKEMQEKNGSRSSYARMEKETYQDGLTENEEFFISRADSFYMASIGANNYPYIQHRGGPKGFLKVLDNKRLGFLDFKGNMQFITVGNLATNNNVAIIIVDYPSRTRLKLYAKAEIVDLNENAELQNQLNLGEYKHRPERILVLHIEAYDWNCPQHITPRYTVEEISNVFDVQQKHIKKLEEEISQLKQKLQHV